MATRKAARLGGRVVLSLSLCLLAACSSGISSDPGGPPGFKGTMPPSLPSLPAEDGSRVGGEGASGLSAPEALSPHEGDLKIDDDGTVVSDLDIRGTVTVTAEDVVLRNVRIRPPEGTEVDQIASLVVQRGSGGGLTLDHVEIDGASVVETAITDISGKGLVVLSSEIHHTGNGIQFANDTLIAGNWIHDIVNRSEWHPDGLQTDGGNNFTIRNNRVTASRDSTSAIGVWADLGDLRRGEVIGNVVAGGGFSFYAQQKGEFVFQDVVFRDNVVTTQVSPEGGVYGVWYIGGETEGLVIEGNRFEDGSPADP